MTTPDTAAGRLDHARELLKNWRHYDPNGCLADLHDILNNRKPRSEVTSIAVPIVGISPEYAKPGDAGADIRSPHRASIPVRGSVTIFTRLAVAIPEGHFGLIVGRSGLGFHHGIRLSNSVGIIDSGYRGQIAVRLHNDGDQPFSIQAGDRIAQLVVVPFVTAEWQNVETLEGTERGGGGFGSTGISS